MLLPGCAAYRVQNPKLKQPISDAAKAEIVGWKTSWKSQSGPDRVLAIRIDGKETEERGLDLSETIQPLESGKRTITVMYYGAQGNFLPKMFSAYADIPLVVKANVRYQTRGERNGTRARLWIVSLPEGSVESDTYEAVVGRIGLWDEQWHPMEKLE